MSQVVVNLYENCIPKLNEKAFQVKMGKHVKKVSEGKCFVKEKRKIVLYSETLEKTINRSIK
jgi:hypothetical protein